MGPIYSCALVAERYGVSVRTVWRWIAAKKLGAVKAGKYYMIRQSDLDRFEASHATITDEKEGS